MAVSDLKWIIRFLLKCSMLGKLTIKMKSSSSTYTTVKDPPQHQFFDDIAATPRILPPVHALVLDSMAFTRQELMRFMGGGRIRFAQLIFTRLTRMVARVGGRNF